MCSCLWVYETDRLNLQSTQNIQMKREVDKSAKIAFRLLFRCVVSVMSFKDKQLNVYGS